MNMGRRVVDMLLEQLFRLQYLTAMGKTEVVQELLARWPQPSVQVNTPTLMIVPPAQELATVFKYKWFSCCTVWSWK